MLPKIQISKSGKAHAANRGAAYADIGKQDFSCVTLRDGEISDFERYL